MNPTIKVVFQISQADYGRPFQAFTEFIPEHSLGTEPTMTINKSPCHTLMGIFVYSQHRLIEFGQL